MAADRLSDFEIHRSYAGSYEQQNGLPPASDQDWSPTDIARWKEAFVDHADILDAILEDIGDIDALDGGHETLIEAINAALAGVTGNLPITSVTGLQTALATLTTNVAAATQDAANAQSAADDAQVDASQALSDAEDAQIDATQALSDAADAQTDATAALTAIDALTDPVYGSIATESLTINAALVDGREEFKQLIDSTSGGVTVFLHSDLATGQELVINRVGGENDVLIDAGADIDVYGADADPLVINGLGWVKLKKLASGWSLIERDLTGATDTFPPLSVSTSQVTGFDAAVKSAIDNVTSVKQVATFAALILSDLDGWDAVETAYHHSLFYGGGARYYRDGTSGSASTGNEIKFYDSNGDGFSLSGTSIDVTVFGAKGDGLSTTDNSRAFTLATDYARSVVTEDEFAYAGARQIYSAGARIKVPAGRYVLSTTGISLPWSSSLVGDGENNTSIIFNLDSSTDGLVLEGQADQLPAPYSYGFYGTVENIKLQGDYVSADTYAVKRVIYCEHFFGTLRNVAAMQSEEEVVRFDICQTARVDKCLFEISATTSTMYVDTGTSLCISGSYIRNACSRSRAGRKACLHLNDVTGVTIDGQTVMEGGLNGANGLLVVGSDVHVSGSYFEANTGADVRVYGSSALTISGGLALVSAHADWQSPFLYAEGPARVIASMASLPNTDGPKVIIDEIPALIQKKILTLPSENFGDELVATGLSSVDTGTLLSVDSTTQVTLPATADTGYQGRLLEITSGPYEGLFRIIKTYDNTTKVATVNAMPAGFTEPADYSVVGLKSTVEQLSSTILHHL